jgi:hypothetical protein
MNGAMTRSTFTVLKLIAGGTFSVWPFVGVLIGNTKAELEPIVTLTGPGRPKLANKEV